MNATAQKSLPGRAAAAMVASGILLSRMVGLVRETATAHYLGSSAAADAFRAALRIPNILQNLLGEGVLSASLIPVYARLRAEGREEEASEVAEAVFAILFLATSLLVVIGIFAAPWLLTIIAPGFQGDKRLLTIHLVRILFPGAALFVFSAWCIGILNSHRKFFLSYAAPVAWNLTIIFAFLWKGPGHDEYRLSIIVSWASVLGAALQVGVQLPSVIRLLKTFRVHFGRESVHVRTVLTNSVPVFISRGVVQISAYVDQMLASFLPTGAVTWLSSAQVIYTLPVSLFGMSVAAAELPAMSSALGNKDEIAAALRMRLSRGLERISFFVVPSAVAFILLGDVVVATIYRSGKFGHSDVIWTWGVLAGLGLGVLASTSGTLYKSAFYALRDTRTPLRFAMIRVVLTLGIGYLLALRVPGLIGIDRRWGVAALALSSGSAGWLEFALLRNALAKRIGHIPLSGERSAKLWGAAIFAAAAAYAIKLVVPFQNSVLVGACVLIPYGVLYFGATHVMGLTTIADTLRAMRRR